jgi:hypothetical protein
LLTLLRTTSAIFAGPSVPESAALAALLTSGAPSARAAGMSSRLPVTALLAASENALCTAGHFAK